MARSGTHLLLAAAFFVFSAGLALYTRALTTRGVSAQPFGHAPPPGLRTVLASPGTAEARGDTDDRRREATSGAQPRETPTEPINPADRLIENPPEGPDPEQVRLRNNAKIRYREFLARYAHDRTLREKLLDALADDPAEVEAIIGEEGYRQFAAFQKSLVFRRSIAALELTFHVHANPLTPTSSESLVRLLEASNVANSIRGNPEAPFPDAFLTAAEGVLSPTQLQVLQQVQLRRIERSESTAELNRLPRP